MASSSIMKRWSGGPQNYVLVPPPSPQERDWASTLMREAREEAARVRANAEAQARTIIEQAEAQRETERQALKDAAMAEVREEIQAELDAEADQTFLRFRDLVKEAAPAGIELRRTQQADIVSLALAVAELIIDEEVKNSPSFVETIASKVLLNAPIESVTHIMVHPDDIAVMQTWLTDGRAAVDTRIELVGDQHVGRGGCVIGTSGGFIDARIETQLAEIRRTLADNIENG